MWCLLSVIMTAFVLGWASNFRSCPRGNIPSRNIPWWRVIKFLWSQYLSFEDCWSVWIWVCMCEGFATSHFTKKTFPNLLMLFNERRALLFPRMYSCPQITKASGTYVISEYSCLLKLNSDWNSSLSSNKTFSILLNSPFNLESGPFWRAFQGANQAKHSTLPLNSVSWKCVCTSSSQLPQG